MNPCTEYFPNSNISNVTHFGIACVLWSLWKVSLRLLLCGQLFRYLDFFLSTSVFYVYFLSISISYVYIRYVLCFFSWRWVKLRFRLFFCEEIYKALAADSCEWVWALFCHNCSNLTRMKVEYLLTKMWYGFEICVINCLIETVKVQGSRYRYRGLVLRYCQISLWLINF